MLNPDYREMLSALFDANVEFVIVGAFALAAHGNPRSTGDIYIYIRPSVENALRLMTALKAFGAPLADVREADFLDPEMVLQIGVIPRRIDLLTGLDGIADFDEAWNTHVTAELDDMTVPILGRDALIRNKRAISRPQDLADIAWLEAHPE